MLYNQRKEEIFELRGDVADPMGTGLRGQAAGINLQNAAEGTAAFRWHDRISEGEVYKEPDGALMFHFYCPNCREALRVTSHKKAITWHKDRGTISIEKFICGHGCGLSVEVHNGVARDVRTDQI